MNSHRRAAIIIIAASLVATPLVARAQSSSRGSQGHGGAAQNNDDDDDDDEDQPPPANRGRTPANGGSSTRPSTGSATTSTVTAATNPSDSAPPAGQATQAGWDFSDHESDTESEARRERMLPRFNTIDGSIGLLHMATAEAGNDQSFRVTMLGSFFEQGFFLRNPGDTTNFPTTLHNPGNNVTYPGSASFCPNYMMTGSCDNAEHVGFNLGVSYSPERHFDIHFGFMSYANYADTSLPHLFQVLGDTWLGVKALLPLDKAGVRGFQLGIDVSLLLMNVTGDIGTLAASTSANFRLLAMLDVQQFAPSVPVRFHLNAGYFLDNSANLVTSVDQQRQAAYPGYSMMDCSRNPSTDPHDPRNENIACQQGLTREERYALGINEADRFNIGIGADARVWWLQFFAEWNVGIPIVRNGYVCYNAPAAPGDDDHCLAAVSSTFAASPSDFTLGVRFMPAPIRGLMGTLAIDAATGGNQVFVRELAPNPPWMFYFGVGFANDFAPRIRRVDVPREVVREVRVDNTPIHGRLAGVVTDAETHQPVPGAVIDLAGHGDLGYVASGPQGHYHTNSIPPGDYELHVRAVDYNENTCRGTIPAPHGSDREVPDVTIDCALRPLPRVGIISGRVTNVTGGTGVGGVTVTLTPVQVPNAPSGAPQGPQSAQTGPDGSYQVPNVLAGSYTVTAGQGPQTRASTPRPLDVRPRETANGDIQVAAVDNHGITVTRGAIQVRDSIHFQTDSAEILPDSNTLVERIADVMNRHAEAAQIEVQGHTDNQGTLPHNMQLSQARAEAVRVALIALGVTADRLTAHGYGPTQPLGPNLTPAGRARNRRVAFVITHRAPATAPTPTMTPTGGTTGGGATTHPASTTTGSDHP